MSEEDRIDDYRKLAGSITNYTDNTCFYEDWLVIQQYVEDWLDELDKLKEEKKQLIEWLESKNKKYLPDYLPATIKIDEVLEYIRRL